MFNSIVRVFYVFRTPRVHRQENHFYVQFLYGMFFMRLYKQSNRQQDVLDLLGCVLNHAFCNSIQIFCVETYFVTKFLSDRKCTQGKSKAITE